VIPAEAVEAAAKEAAEADLQEWDQLSEYDQHYWRWIAKHALEAAAPYIVKPVTDAEYALIRKHMSDSCAVFFDELRESGARIREATGDRARHLNAWRRAVAKARREGLGRYVRVHDLRLTKIHHAWITRKARK
jgi:hypothetical protein